MVAKISIWQPFFFIPVAKNDTGRDLPLQGKK